MKTNKIVKKVIALTSLFFLAGILEVFSAGTLTPKNSPNSPIQIQDHHVDVIINNSFSKTEVTQTFYNPNSKDLEGIYSFPVPKNASLSEVTIYAGETEINGEVLEKKKARNIYEEEKKNGNDAGLAEKKGFKTYEFYIAKIPSLNTTRMRIVYYEPIKIDTGISRYLYPLQDGGTDEVAESFWLSNSKVENNFSFNVEFKSSWPIENIRVPSFMNEATITKNSENHYTIIASLKNASLSKDLIVYAKYQDNLPGRVEVIPYRTDDSKEGTFMMVVTPGIDLKAIDRGSDYIFVLDISGSMQSKIRTLANGVEKTIKQMNDNDRFKIIIFNDQAQSITKGFINATKENITKWSSKVQSLTASGSTNLYSGLKIALNDLNDDRVSSIILVTDAVTNTGVVDKKEFFKLLKNYDIRIFGFLMGNSANWPLMDLISKTTGGFSKGVSNDDDIIGQILLAKSKIRHECIHDVELKIDGVKTYDITNRIIPKVYRGEQLVFFGKYKNEGIANVTLKTKMSGEDKVYTTSFNFPKIALDDPEIERLWALARIKEIQYREDIGLINASETENMIQDIGVKYQIVTDYTSMVVLSDEVFSKRGIQRRNKARVTIERKAMSRRNSTPIRNYRIDNKKPAFKIHTPSLSGGGSLDIFALLFTISLLGLVSLNKKK